LASTSKQHLLQSSIFEITAEHRIQRKHRGQQRRHPDDAGRNPRQQIGLGTNRQWKQRNHQHEEQQRIGQLGTVAHRDQQIAAQQEGKGLGQGQAFHADRFNLCTSWSGISIS